MRRSIRPISELKEGTNLPEVTKVVTQENINLYAEASKDFNPIHIDSAFAGNTALGGTIAHGMLILAYLSQMMSSAFGRHWLNTGKLNVRFKAPARPGDTVTAAGKVSKIDKSKDRVSVNCNVLCKNQKGVVIITGDATIEAKENENSY